MVRPIINLMRLFSGGLLFDEISASKKINALQ